jgi:hypothetical protein
MYYVSQHEFYSYLRYWVTGGKIQKSIGLQEEINMSPALYYSDNLRRVPPL